MILSCHDIPVADQPAAMRLTFRHLTDMPVPGGWVWLKHWDWLVVADTVAQCVSTMRLLRFAVSVTEPLTDELLRVVMRMGRNMTHLQAASLALQSDHIRVSWPCASLHIWSADVAQLLRLPVPAAAAQLTVDTLSLASLSAETQVRTHKQQTTSTVAPWGQPHRTGFMYSHARICLSTCTRVRPVVNEQCFVFVYCVHAVGLSRAMPLRHPSVHTSRTLHTGDIRVARK